MMQITKPKGRSSDIATWRYSLLSWSCAVTKSLYLASHFDGFLKHQQLRWRQIGLKSNGNKKYDEHTAKAKVIDDGGQNLSWSTGQPQEAVVAASYFRLFFDEASINRRFHIINMYNANRRTQYEELLTRNKYCSVDYWYCRG